MVYQEWGRGKFDLIYIVNRNNNILRRTFNIIYVCRRYTDVTDRGFTRHRVCGMRWRFINRFDVSLMPGDWRFHRKIRKRAVARYDIVR